MPKKPFDYSKAIIYKIVCKDVSIQDCYVGSTTNLVKRRYNHKTNCKNVSNKKYNYYVYKFIRDHGDFDNFDFVEVEKYDAKDKEDLHRRERYHIEKLCATLNKQMPSRTAKEWKSIRYECDCSGRYTLSHKASHYRTKKHLDYYSSYKDDASL